MYPQFDIDKVPIMPQSPQSTLGRKVAQKEPASRK
jgi:hypothetical protein